MYVRNEATPPWYDTATVLVNVLDTNDNPPVFQSTSYDLQVPENAPMDVVHTVRASDADIGSNEIVSYFIVGWFTSPLKAKLNHI